MKRVYLRTLLFTAGAVFTPVAIYAASFQGPGSGCTPPNCNVPGVIWNMQGTGQIQPGARIDIDGEANFGNSGQTNDVLGNIGLENAKAFVVSQNGSATFYMGNWYAAVARALSFTTYGDIYVDRVSPYTGVGLEGRVQARKFCFYPGTGPNDCVTNWNSGLHVLKAGDSMTGQLNINSASSYGLFAESPTWGIEGEGGAVGVIGAVQTNGVGTAFLVRSNTAAPSVGLDVTNATARGVSVDTKGANATGIRTYSWGSNSTAVAAVASTTDSIAGSFVNTPTLAGTYRSEALLGLATSSVYGSVWGSSDEAIVGKNEYYDSYGKLGDGNFGVYGYGNNYWGGYFIGGTAGLQARDEDTAVYANLGYSSYSLYGNGDVRTSGNGYFSGDLQSNGDVVAATNALDNCSWTAYIANGTAISCPAANPIMSGVQSNSGGTSMRAYCCDL
jgi:hypothetical protein